MYVFMYIRTCAMYPSLCKRFQLSSRVGALVHSKSQLGFLPCNEISSSQQQQQEEEAIVRFFSTCSLKEKQSFAISYLVNSCGLSLQTAISVSQKVHFKTPEKPDSVLVLLRNYGFTHTHITKILRKNPKVLVADPEKTLVPKFEFLHSIGISSDDIVKFISFNPFILGRSLEKQLLPLYNLIKNVVRGDDDVAKAFMRLGWLSSDDVRNNLAPNVAVLRQLGVPESSISSTLVSLPNVVLQDRNRFGNVAKKVISMGYDPIKTQFIQAMHVFSSFKKTTREHKIEVYKRWGWSENEIGLAMKNYPSFLLFSEENIMNTMDFLVNKMGYQSNNLARCPSLLGFSLEKRIIPRCLVIKILLLKGLLKNELRLSTLLQFSEKQFLEKFVTRYQEDIPQLSNIYQVKTSLLELGFSSKDIRGLKPL